jgi:hypothetical protein
MTRECESREIELKREKVKQNERNRKREKVKERSTKERK